MSLLDRLRWHTRPSPEPVEYEPDRAFFAWGTDRPSTVLGVDPAPDPDDSPIVVMRRAYMAQINEYLAALTPEQRKLHDTRHALNVITLLTHGSAYVTQHDGRPSTWTWQD